MKDNIEERKTIEQISWDIGDWYSDGTKNVFELQDKIKEVFTQEVDRATKDKTKEAQWQLNERKGLLKTVESLTQEQKQNLATIKELEEKAKEEIKCLEHNYKRATQKIDKYAKQLQTIKEENEMLKDDHTFYQLYKSARKSFEESHDQLIKYKEVVEKMNLARNDKDLDILDKHDFYEEYLNELTHLNQKGEKE